MWISIIGPVGSGKSLVKKILESRNFQLESELFNFSTSIEYRSDFYFKHDQAAFLKRLNNDIFTIGSFWDYHECIVPVMFENFEITESELYLMNERYNTTKEFLEPPTCVIFTKMSEQQAYNRLMLSGEVVNHLVINKIERQLQYYEKFIQKVAVPVIEIDMGQNIDMALNDLNFSIDSILTSRLDTASIWKRNMFH